MASIDQSTGAAPGLDAAERLAHRVPPTPVLLDDAQGAAIYGIGMRTFLELQTQPWFPKPILLGPRLKRHVLSELVAAIQHMPRQQERTEPAQLLRAKVERLKRGPGAAGQREGA